MIDRLAADGPSPELAGQLDLFGRFTGIWDLEWRGRGLDGSPVVVPGELSFGWILDGRAIQDVWRVPLDPADRTRMRAFHGTTIRFFDPAIAAWRSTWIDPLNGRVRRFIGHVKHGVIVLVGEDPDPRERWTFRDITPESFLWRGEVSVDGGATWVVDEQMYARRRQTDQA